MKIICNTASITEACLNVQRAVASRSVNPSLEGICIKTTNQGIEVNGYDMEVGINTIIDAGIAEEGGTVINAKTLCDILRHLPGDNMSLESDDKNKCIIKSGDTEYSIIGNPVQDYPELPYVMGGTPVVLPQDILKEMIRKVIFAVSTDDSRPIYKGVKFEISENELSLIALDGYRLAVRREKVDYNGEYMTFIVPSKPLQEIIKLINDDNGYISINLDKSHIVFSLNGYNIVSRLIEGQFVDYRKTIPSEFETEIKVNTQDFIESIDRMSLLINEKFKTPLKCIFEDNSIRFLSSTSLGSANDRISASINGVRVEKGFNNKYLSDAFRAIEADRVLIRMNTQKNSPACIFPLDGDGFYYMVLPVNV